MWVEERPASYTKRHNVARGQRCQLRPKDSRMESGQGGQSSVQTRSLGCNYTVGLASNEAILIDIHLYS